MLGQDLRIYIDDAAVASCTSCEVTYQMEPIEVSGQSVKGREYIAGRETWRVTCSWLVTVGNFDIHLAMLGTSVSLEFKSSLTGIDGVTGEALVTECAITATRGSLATGRFEFTGTGNLTPIT